MMMKEEKKKKMKEEKSQSKTEWITAVVMTVTTHSMF